MGLVGYSPQRRSRDDGPGLAAKVCGGAIALVLGFFLLIVSPLLLFTGGAAALCGPEGGVSAAQDDGPLPYDESKPDPESIPPLEIATRVYVVGRDVMRFERREILTAFTVVLVESGGGVTMRNPWYGDRDSVGAFQQRNIAPWNARERRNVAAAAHSFYEALREFDHGQSIGELAADIQRPAEQYRDRYRLALPEAKDFYERVEARLGAGGPVGVLGSGECSDTTGPAQLNQATTLYRPRSFAQVPSRYVSGDPEEVDARILPNVVYLARRYGLVVTQGRKPYPPSVSHGYGTSVDFVDADGQNWEDSAQRAAEDLGWSSDCGSSGERPACDLVPAILAIYYNGYPNHGEGNHIHITWYGPMGPSDGLLHPPLAWVKVFPAPGVPDKG